MSRIRAEGYSEEVVNRWKNEYNIRNAYRRFRTQSEIDRLKTRAKVRIIYIGLTLPFIITIFILYPGRIIATLLFSAVIALIISLMVYWARN